MPVIKVSLSGLDQFIVYVHRGSAGFFERFALLLTETNAFLMFVKL